MRGRARVEVHYEGDRLVVTDDSLGVLIRVTEKGEEGWSGIYLTPPECRKVARKLNLVADHFEEYGL